MFMFFYRNYPRLLDKIYSGTHALGSSIKCGPLSSWVPKWLITRTNPGARRCVTTFQNRLVWHLGQWPGAGVVSRYQSMVSKQRGHSRSVGLL